MKTRKILATLLTLAMMMGLLCTGAAATNPTSLTLNANASVTSIQIAGQDVNTASDPYVTGSPNQHVTYDIVLNSSTSSTATVTINFTKPDANVISTVPPAGNPNQFRPMILANANTTFTCTLANGSGTKNLYVHKNFANTYGSCDTYTFNFTVATRNNPVEPDNDLLLRFGDPQYPNTEPECYMSFDTGTNTDYDAVYANGPLSNYYPDLLTLYVESASGSTVSFSSANANNVCFVTYDNQGNPTESGSASITGSGAVAVKIYAAGNITVGGYTIHFSTPQAATVSGGSAPAYVNGYLPLGQYATGAGWGSIFTNYNNVDGLAANDAVTKITSGYASTGISLGSPGGYVQFEFAADVENNPANKYGIDFVIYGNPFVGNPEAASVKVSSNGTDWYELAGSRYYSSDTSRNTTISYKMIPTSTYGTDKKADIYYAIGTPPTGTGTTGWTLYKSNVTWWPESSAEGYGTVSGVGTALRGNHAVNGVTYTQLTETSNGYNCWQISHSGVTLVQDTDTTDDYIFGYADVRHVGNTRDGTACNPYATLPSTGTSSMVGGDGFDISWAVNPDGTPKELASIRYVRIYTSAALDPNNLTALPAPGIFGETSAEVCGMFTAQESGSGTAAAPEITIDDQTFDDLIDLDATVTVTPVSDNQQIISIYGLEDAWGAEFDLEVSGGTYIFMNGSPTATTPIDLSTGPATVQIINQSGTAEPFISLVKIYS